MARLAISEAGLLEKIRTSLRNTSAEADDCADCVPTRLGPVKAVAGGINWQVLAWSKPCAPNCQAKALELCKQLGEQYDIAWEACASAPPK